MTIDTVVASAQEHLRAEGVDGWLVYDYRGMNPVFEDTVGHVANVTRPCWLWVPASGEPRLLLSYVDAGRFDHLGVDAATFVSRREMVDRLRETLEGARRVAMEYSPEGGLPRMSRVDAGILELVRGLGVEVVPSADTVQYATQRWSDEQLASHLAAADLLGRHRPRGVPSRWRERRLGDRARRRGAHTLPVRRERAAGDGRPGRRRQRALVRPPLRADGGQRRADMPGRLAADRPVVEAGGRRHDVRRHHLDGLRRRPCPGDPPACLRRGRRGEGRRRGRRRVRVRGGSRATGLGGRRRRQGAHCRTRATAATSATG